MNSILKIVLIFISPLLQPPILKGIVVDQDSSYPVSYVSIGIINTPFGTYSDENGRFKMDLARYVQSDSIRFSCIGYNTLTFSVDEFLETYSAGTDTIYLVKKVTELKEVIVYSKQYKVRTIGNKLSNKAILLGFVDDMERGIMIENDNMLFLNNVSFRLTMADQTTPDSAIFRFNVYNVKEDLPVENILTEPIYFYLKGADFNGTNKFDISKYNISIDEDFAATFELVRQYGGGRIYFTGWLSGRQSVRRNGKQGAWIETKSDKSGTKLHQMLKIEVLHKK